METCGNLILEMYYEENKKKQNEEKKDNPSIVAQCICGLDENPELVVEIGRLSCIAL